MLKVSYKTALAQAGLTEDQLGEKARTKISLVARLEAKREEIKNSKSVVHFKNGNMTENAKRQIAAYDEQIDDLNDDLLEIVAGVMYAKKKAAEDAEAEAEAQRQREVEEAARLEAEKNNGDGDVDDDDIDDEPEPEPEPEPAPTRRKKISPLSWM